MDIGSIHNALKRYCAKKGRFPDMGSGLRVLVALAREDTGWRRWS